jgi:ferredoxin-NADP reductase/Na+-translocating ferredoxin:NAD+ oxidoreductase RnfD subunit
MLSYLDNQLNRITMYRLVLFVLIGYLALGVFFSNMGILKNDPYWLLFSSAVLLAVCLGVNWIFARTYGIAANVESAAITALILALIITPMQSLNDLWFLIWAGILAMASKYILAIKGKHLFNPAALAVALTYFSTSQSASWWIGNGAMLPAVLAGGLLLVRKLRRFELVTSFLVSTMAVTLIASLLGGSNFFAAAQKLLLYSPLVFFASLILTEPLTTPPTRKLQIYYAAIVGVLANPQIHLGSFYITPELAIIIGNVFSYIVGPKETFMLKFREKFRLAPDTYEFVFAPNKQIAFEPGQYMEWTLGHAGPDSRGNRRYFTLASAPTEHNLKLGIRFSERSSSYKQALLDMKWGSQIRAAQLAGDFVLPSDPGQRCVFIAGGIGVTPFRSMLKYLLDTRQRRAVTLFYSVKSADEIVYRDVFDKAEKELGIKVIYTISRAENAPAGWTGKTGRISAEMIKAEVPDYRQAMFYISGPDAMVETFKTDLRGLNVARSQIKTDYFAGF